MPFASPKHASIAKQVIEVDAELQPSFVKRTITVDGENLIAYVEPVDLTLPAQWLKLLLVDSIQQRSALLV